MDSSAIINKAINAKRDIQTIKQARCKKCGFIPLIAETMMRDRYRVDCCCGKNETDYFPTIDEAVIAWNKKNEEGEK